MMIYKISRLNIRDLVFLEEHYIVRISEDVSCFKFVQLFPC